LGWIGTGKTGCEINLQIVFVDVCIWEVFWFQMGHIFGREKAIWMHGLRKTKSIVMAMYCSRNLSRRFLIFFYLSITLISPLPLNSGSEIEIVGGWKIAKPQSSTTWCHQRAAQTFLVIVTLIADPPPLPATQKRTW